MIMFKKETNFIIFALIFIIGNSIYAQNKVVEQEKIKRDIKNGKTTFIKVLANLTTHILEYKKIIDQLTEIYH